MTVGDVRGALAPEKIDHMAPRRHVFIRRVAAPNRPRVAGIIRLMRKAQKNRPMIVAQPLRVSGNISIEPSLDRTKMSDTPVSKRAVGQPVDRVDGREKVLGSATFAADHHIPNLASQL